MNYISETNKEELSFVICSYENQMIYHDFDNSNNKLSAGKPLSIESAKALFRFTNEVQDIKNYGFSDIIPKNVLKFETDEKYIIWTSNHGMRNILYADNLPVKSRKYWVPKMVWKLENNSLNVWAIIKDVKNKNDKLYNAPFFNVSSSGSVCMGSAKLNQSGHDYISIMKKAETSFWNSIFTHSNNDNLLNFNFTEWCNNPKLNQLQCNDLLVETNQKIKDIF